MTRTLSLAVLFVVAAFAATAYYYPHLPDPMPVHFDLHGRPDGWAPLPWGALVAPVAMVVVGIAFAFSHARVAAQRGDEATRALDIVALVTLAFVLEVHVVVLVYATGAHVDLNRWVLGGVGLLFAITGNYFGKLERNGVVGLRTARTMADPEVWLLSHRFAGRVMVLGGAIVFVAALAGAPPAALLVLILATTFVPLVYSYTVKPRSRS